MSGNVSPLKAVPRDTGLPTFNFTGADVVAEIRRLAERFPDELAQCKYVDNDRPHCIAGRALANLGVPLAVLKQVEHTAIDTAMVRLRIKDTIEQAQWARDVQSYQDNGLDWHHAVASADRLHPDMAVTP